MLHRLQFNLHFATIATNEPSSHNMKEADPKTFKIVSQVAIQGNEEISDVGASPLHPPPPPDPPMSNPKPKTNLSTRFQGTLNSDCKNGISFPSKPQKEITH